MASESGGESEMAAWQSSSENISGNGENEKAWRRKAKAGSAGGSGENGGVKRQHGAEGIANQWHLAAKISSSQRGEMAQWRGGQYRRSVAAA
jgi:hypothetical protein